MKQKLIFLIGILIILGLCSAGFTQLSAPVPSPKAASQDQGIRLAFVSSYYNDEDDPENEKIYLVNLDGSNLTRLTGNGRYITEDSPTWSPDGCCIAFASNFIFDAVRQEAIPSDTDAIYVADADSHNVVRITPDSVSCGSPVWSPDGQQLAFVSWSSIYVIAIGDSEPVYLADGFSPRWSPDGQHVAFTLQGDDGLDVGIVDADGSNLINLTEHPARDFDPAWSPDGSQIVFVSNREDNYNVYRIDADGSNLRQLTDGDFDASRPTWSPDGRWIAFSSQGSIFAMKPDGSNLLTTGPINAIDGFEWLPDSSGLVFLAGFEPSNPCVAIHRVDLTCDPEWTCTFGGVIRIPNTEAFF